MDEHEGKVTVEGRRRRKLCAEVRSPVLLLLVLFVAGVRVVTDALALTVRLSRLLLVFVLLWLRTSSSIESVRNRITPPPFSQ